MISGALGGDILGIIARAVLIGTWSVLNGTSVVFYDTWSVFSGT